MALFTNHLRTEHETILKQLSMLELCKNSLELLTHIKKLESMFLYHHGFEEDHLFQALHETHKVSSGGPNCTLFFGLYLDTHSYLQNLLKEGVLYLEKEQEHIQRFFTEKSMLTIPIEEHRACHILMEQMKNNILESQEQQYKRTLEKYANLLRLHIRKENECLFHLADNLLDETCQKKLFERIIEPHVSKKDYKEVYSPQN
jgi:hemerythrin-like domain-containing protein